MTITHTTLFWEKFDYLIHKCFFRETALVESALKATEETGYPFWASLPHGVEINYESWYSVYGDEGLECPSQNPYR